MFTPSESYEAGTQNRPYGSLPLTGRGDPGLANYNTAIGGTETDILTRDLHGLKVVKPGMYDPLTSIFFSKKPKTILGEVHEFFERGWSISPITVNTNAAAVAASANATVTQTIVITAGTIDYAGVGARFKYPVAATGSATPSEGTIKSVDRGTNTIVVMSQTGEGLPAVTAGMTFAQMGGIGTDGQSGVDSFTRLQYGQRNNYLGSITNYKSWTPREIAKYDNLGAIDGMFSKDIDDLRERMRYFMAANFLNSKKGMSPRWNGTAEEYGYDMGGVFPYAVAAGASYTQNVPLAGLRTQFEAMEYATNMNGYGSSRTVIAPRRVLGALTDLYKENVTRVGWSDMVAKLDLTAIVRGGTTLNLVPIEILQESSLFEPAWGTRLSILDLDAIDVCAMRGVPMYKEWDINNMYGGDGSLKKQLIYCAEANFTLEMAEPRRHAFCDIIGLA
jgi:hypothetical protein